ncbi:MAG: hypothetical protein ACHQ6T_13905 [Myxococcota bacterium]
MERESENVDAWVVARIGELERANRRLWIGITAVFTTLVSLGIAGVLFAAHFELPESGLAPGGVTGSLRVGDLEVHRSLRVVDDDGRNLIWLGREPEGAGAGAPQAVLGLFAGDGSGEPQQTVRIATSKLGSALSLSSPDGGSSSSLFAGVSSVSLELRRGANARTLNETRDSGAAGSQSSSAPAPARAPAAAPRSESEALAARPAAEPGAAVIDLTNPTLQSLGGGFLVGPTSVTDSSGGLRIRGRIVNSTSVDQARAEFRMVIGTREVSFSVARVAAGGSAPFAVELPASGKADVRAARMRWVRSSVSYGEE